MKRILVYFFALFAVTLLATSCSDKNANLPNKSERVAKSWRVVDAKFGVEDMVEGSFANYLVTLNADGTYAVKNPDNAPTVNLTTSNAGKWKFNDAQTVITFDAGTPQMVEVRLNQLSANGKNMEWEWRVAKPGKVETTYIFMLEAVN